MDAHKSKYDKNKIYLFAFLLNTFYCPLDFDNTMTGPIYQNFTIKCSIISYENCRNQLVINLCTKGFEVGRTCWSVILKLDMKRSSSSHYINRIVGHIGNNKSISQYEMILYLIFLFAPFQLKFLLNPCFVFH